MKALVCLLLCFSLVSCLQKKQQEEPQTFIVKYGNNEVYTAQFINKMMTLGFVKYGKNFYSKIYEPVFFEQMRSETLEHVLNSILMNSLSQKYELKITNKDVQKWIEDRAPVYSKEDLILTLQTNNLTYKDWTNLFREQLVQHRISQKLNVEAKETGTDNKEKKTNSKKQTFYKIAVLTFENQLDADKAYKQVGNSTSNFKETLKRRQSSKKYSWLTKEEIPFFSEIKRLRKGRVSKPFETDWGFLLVHLEKKEKRLPQIKDIAEFKGSSSLKELVEEFRKDPKLQINSDLLYSLKIKK